MTGVNLSRLGPVSSLCVPVLCNYKCTTCELTKSSKRFRVQDRSFLFEAGFVSVAFNVAGLDALILFPVLNPDGCPLYLTLRLFANLTNNFPRRLHLVDKSNTSSTIHIVRGIDMG